MYLGAYTACLADTSLGEALDIIADLNGNPLYPRADFPHSQDLIDSIELAALLRVGRAVTMSGSPGSEPGTSVPVWNPLPWWSPFLDVQDHQWSVTIPYWKDSKSRAADADVKIAIDMHPGTMHRLAAEINGVIDDSFTRVAEGQKGYLPLGGGTTLSGWPKTASWDFVAVGRGHDTSYWTEFLRALHEVDPDMPVNIEHEDQELDQLEGLRFAANTLIEAEKGL